MIPYLKDGNWDAGMVAGLKATCQRLDGSMEMMLSPILTAVVLLILFLLFFVLSPLAEVLLSFRHANKVAVRIVVNINCREAEAESYPGLME